MRALLYVILSFGFGSLIQAQDREISLKGVRFAIESEYHPDSTGEFTNRVDRLYMVSPTERTRIELSNHPCGNQLVRIERLRMFNHKKHKVLEVHYTCFVQQKTARFRIFSETFALRIPDK